MEMRDELRAKWSQSRQTARGGHEWRTVLLSQIAPLRILAAVREPDERTSILFETRLADAPSRRLHMAADGISLQDQRRPEEGLFRLAITLEQEPLRSIFEVLAQDLINVAQVATDAPQAIAAIVRRLEAWQACLRQRRQGLSRESQIGLIGELTIYHMLAVCAGHDVAIEAWQGPLDGLHDFNRLGLALEIKSVAGIGSRIRISHLDQLETQGLSQLILMRLQFRESQDGTTLTNLAGEIGDLISREAPHHRPDFDERLLRAGYARLDPEDDADVQVILEETRAYDVRQGFPRLTARSVASGIAEAHYSIDERAVASFRIDDKSVRDVMLKMKGSSV